MKENNISDDDKNTLRGEMLSVLKHYNYIPDGMTKKAKYQICCTFHAERNPSMSVDVKNGLYHCFSCGASGDTFSFVAHEEGLDTSRDFAKVVQIVASISGQKCSVGSLPNTEYSKRQPKQEPQTEYYYIPKDTLNSMAAHANETSLYAFLCGLFPAEDVDRVFGLYRLGGSRHINALQGGRAISYPYINAKLHCVDCKVMHLDPVSGSRKSAPPIKTWTEDGEQRESKVTWALAELRMKHLRAPWCNFGEHLLSLNPHKPVGILESEKSAVILSLMYPDIVWLAVGSESNLNAERLKPCKGRKITIYPDRDAYSRWKSIADDLAKEYSITIDTTILDYGNGKNDDLADLMIALKKGTLQQNHNRVPADSDTPKPKPRPCMVEAERIWEQCKQVNPELQVLEDTLALTPMHFTPTA